MAFPLASRGRRRSWHGALHNDWAMLQVRDLALEVGGRLILDGRLVPAARRRQGRPGRPQRRRQDSLLKVLGGRAPAAGGTCCAAAALGYLPQDPRPRGIDADANGRLARAVGPRPRRGGGRLEKLRLQLEEDPTDRNIAPVRRAPRSEFRARRRLRGRVRRSRRIAAGLGPAAPTGSTCPSACCRVASAAGSSWRASCSRAATCCCSTSPPTTSTSTPRVADVVPARVPRRAAGDQPRPRPARRGDHPRARTSTEERELVEYRGTYSQYLDGPRAGRGPPGEARRARRTQEIRRLPTWPTRCGTRPRSAPARPRRSTRASTSSRAQPGRRPAKRERTLKVRFPEPPPPRRTVHRGRRAWPRRYGGPPCSRTCRSTSGAASGC